MTTRNVRNSTVTDRAINKVRFGCLNDIHMSFNLATGGAFIFIGMVCVLKNCCFPNCFLMIGGIVAEVIKTVT